MSKSRVMADLRLDLEAAREGRTWLLLPEGFRDQESGTTYPLPSASTDLQTLAGIYIPGAKRDSGCIYLRRAFDAWKQRAGRKESALHDVNRRIEQIHEAHRDYRSVIKELKKTARSAVASVQAEAERAIASLDQLFALGRKGIEAQMAAHMHGTEWQGEKIDARAFRECFRLISQAVKGLGLPTAQRESAGKAIVDELAASLDATKDALALAPKEIEH